jgi:predicted ATPase with chaperone activity
MRFLISPEFHRQMLQRRDHTPDCYVRPGQYLHHIYVEGVKYVVAPALGECLREAQERDDVDAVRHLKLHADQYEQLLQQALNVGPLDGVTLLGDPPPGDDGETVQRIGRGYVPPQPKTLDDTGLSAPFLSDMVLRTIYTRGRITGSDIASALKLPFGVIAPLLPAMRKQLLIDIVGQKGGGGDATYEYEIKPPRGADAVEDALEKSGYTGPAPVPFDDYVESVMAQTIRYLVVTRRSIQKAFADLIVTEDVFNEIGPAINSAQSIFLFGFPGNGKTAVAERITRLMGDSIYVPYAVEANGQVIKVYDPIVHKLAPPERADDGLASVLFKTAFHDERYVKIVRPTIVVGGELTLNQLDLKYNAVGKFYEAPFQMKANGGVFMIDDFGRQQVRAMDLLNRWIVPLEKKYDYLTTVSGTKVEVPFDQLLIFSTNLDPNQLADEAFLRRIKFKIEIRDPSERQYRQIWQLVCRNREVEYDERGVDYLIEKWYRPVNRPFRMCQPRDLLDQMFSLAKYGMERVTFTPDLIDAACSTYFVSQEKRDFGAKVRLD